MPSPPLEKVGWTILSGKDETDVKVPITAKGQTIVNTKFGLRFGLGQASEPGVLSTADLYLGYGRALTGEVWYKNIIRAEWRFHF